MMEPKQLVSGKSGRGPLDANQNITSDAISWLIEEAQHILACPQFLEDGIMLWRNPNSDG